MSVAPQISSPDLDRLIASAHGGSASFKKLLELLSESLWSELGDRRKCAMGPSHGLSDLIQDTLACVHEKSRGSSGIRSSSSSNGRA